MWMTTRVRLNREEGKLCPLVDAREPSCVFPALEVQATPRIPWGLLNVKKAEIARLARVSA
jgi:hypothetical protein